MLFLCRKLSRKRFSEDTLDKYNRIIANTKVKGRENKKASRVVNKCRNVKNESCRQIVKKNGILEQ